MSKVYTVEAKRWEHGWELHIKGVGVTWAKSLRSAARMVRQYIKDIDDESTITIEIRSEIGAVLDDQVNALREAISELADRQRQVAALSRAAAKDLSQSGLSGIDIAVVLNVSPQRVSQLLNA